MSSPSDKNGSYYEKFLGKKQKKTPAGLRSTSPPTKDDPNYSSTPFVDKEAYVNFLEHQLEKISNTSYNMESVQNRLLHLENQMSFFQKQYEMRDDAEVELKKQITNYFESTKSKIEQTYNEIFNDNTIQRIRNLADKRWRKQQELLEECMIRLNKHVNNPRVHEFTGDSSVDKKKRRNSLNASKPGLAKSAEFTSHEEEKGKKKQKYLWDLFGQEGDLNLKEQLFKHETKIEDIESYIANMKKDTEKKIQDVMESQKEGDKLLKTQQDKGQDFVTSKFIRLENEIFKFQNDISKFEQAISKNEFDNKNHSTNLNKDLADQGIRIRKIECELNEQLTKIKFGIHSELDKLKSLRETMESLQDKHSIQSEAEDKKRRKEKQERDEFKRDITGLMTKMKEEFEQRIGDTQRKFASSVETQNNIILKNAMNSEKLSKIMGESLKNMVNEKLEERESDKKWRREILAKKKANDNNKQKKVSIPEEEESAELEEIENDDEEQEMAKKEQEIVNARKRRNIQKAVAAIPQKQKPVEQKKKPQVSNNNKIPKRVQEEEEEEEIEEIEDDDDDEEEEDDDEEIAPSRENLRKFVPASSQKTTNPEPVNDNRKKKLSELYQRIAELVEN